LIVTGSFGQPAAIFIGSNTGNSVAAVVISGSSTGIGSTGLIAVAGGSAGSAGIIGIGTPGSANSVGIAGIGGILGGIGGNFIGVGGSANGVQGQPSTASIGAAGVKGTGQSSGSWGVWSLNQVGGYALFVQGKSSNPDTAPILLMTQSRDPNTGSFGAFYINESGIMRAFGSGNIGWYPVGTWNTGSLILTSSISDITISGNLKSSGNGRILGDRELIFSSALGRLVYSSSLIIPSGGGTFFGGNGIVVGYHTPRESIHVVDGNMRVEGTGDLAYIVKSHDLVEEPQFRMGSIIYGGDGDPNCRFIYSDISSSERSVFEFDKKGIIASIKQAYGTHFEGFISGEVNPLFRLNSSPSMSLEFGRGDDAWTDIILRRKDIGHLHLLAQLSGGQDYSGSLDVANVYNSYGHLILSSTHGTVTISGNLNVLGNVSAISGISGSGGSGGPVTGSQNFFVQNILDVSGTIRNPVGDLRLTSSTNRTVHTGSIILPVGGGTGGGGYGIAIGANLAWDALHIFDGNARLEGNNEYSYIVKRTDMTNGPQFQIGRLAGDGDPKIRFMYEDSETSERSVFDVTKSGTVGSIKPAGIYGSHFEGYVTGDTQPLFRLNSYPSMSLEFGSGSNITTDIILRRKKAGHFHIQSQLSNGTQVTGNLDVANIYSSEGHLHLSSTFGTVAVSGNLKITGDITNTVLNNFTQSINSFTASFSASVLGIADGKYLFTSSFAIFTGTNNAFTQSVNLFTASFKTLSQSLNTFSASMNAFTASYNSLSQSFNTRTITAVFDGGGQVLAAGAKAYINEIPYNSTITGWRIASPIAGDCVVDVWRDQYANWPPTVADTIITGSEKPTLAGTNKNEDKSLTTWQINNVAGDGLVFNIDSASTVTYVTVQVFIKIP
jgi:hypothetical protein